MKNRQPEAPHKRTRVNRLWATERKENPSRIITPQLQVQPERLSTRCATEEHHRLVRPILFDFIDVLFGLVTAQETTQVESQDVGLVRRILEVDRDGIKPFRRLVERGVHRR